MGVDGRQARGWNWWKRLWPFGRDVDPHGQPLPRPKVRHHSGYASLQFVDWQTQSRMVRAEPDRLLIDYTATMLGTLLLQPEPKRIGMLGLGGGSQVKFIHRHLPEVRLEVVENHPGVLRLRRRFRIPDDDARLQVVLDDGLDFLQQRPGRYDILLVDAYDQYGIPGPLSTQAFYDLCRSALAPAGAMATNLFVEDHDAHVQKLRHAFGAANVVVVDEPKMSNQVAVAWRDGPAPRLPDDPGQVPQGLSAAGRRELGPAFRRVAVELAHRRKARR